MFLLKCSNWYVPCFALYEHIWNTYDCAAHLHTCKIASLNLLLFFSLAFWKLCFQTCYSTPWRRRCCLTRFRTRTQIIKLIGVFYVCTAVLLSLFQHVRHKSSCGTCWHSDSERLPPHSFNFISDLFFPPKQLYEMCICLDMSKINAFHAFVPYENIQKHMNVHLADTHAKLRLCLYFCWLSLPVWKTVLQWKNMNHLLNTLSFDENWETRLR